MIKLFNTKTREIEEFQPAGSVVKMYSCGPTVYGFQHIGNFASYVYWDLLVRVLEDDGFQVERVINLTDVGHLTSDGDEGEDKLEKGARRENKSVYEVAEFYIEDFLKGFSALELTPPKKFCRATDYIEADEKIVAALIDKGYGYLTRDGVYFDTAKLPEYADFARLDLKNLREGARVEFSDEKRNASDFALWKFIQEGEKHAMRWDFLGRPGYPGWHIECSTIVHEELKEPIDIHTGGIDHIPVHHTNEIAQTKAAFGTELAGTWLHCNFLTIDGEKISKSIGNVVLLPDIEEKGYSLMDFKLWVFQGHYQSARNFSFSDLAAAAKRRLNFRNAAARSRQVENLSDGAEILSEIRDALQNNLNSAMALAKIDEAINRGECFEIEFWEKVDELLGLRIVADAPEFSSEALSALQRRAEARKNKDYSLSDEIREELKKMGLGVRDEAEGQILEYLK